jgi:hypothetical protein
MKIINIFIEIFRTKRVNANYYHFVHSQFHILSLHLKLLSTNSVCA